MDSYQEKILPLSQKTVPNFLEIYIKKTQNIPIELMIHAEKIRIFHKVKEMLERQFPAEILLSVEEQLQQKKITAQIYTEKNYSTNLYGCQ